MLRTHTCGELRISTVDSVVTLSGWIHRVRQLSGMNFIELRDRYGITQLSFQQATNPELYNLSNTLGREYVVQIVGKVIERQSKNAKLPTGDIEIEVQSVTILNISKNPPFTLEDDTDGGDELRMKYRYLDLRRNAVRANLELRHKAAQCTREYLNNLDFLEVETPYLIKSTPEGARDFIVPSRMNAGQFYALPQSPQTFKQLLMVAGLDRYYQIVRCFRDEDLRADRQPEFTQVDVEMTFVEQEDILQIFEGWIKFVFKTIKGIDIPALPRMTFDDAMKNYGSDKPDIRFEMLLQDITTTVKGYDFPVFEAAEYVVAIVAKGAATYTRKDIDALTDFVKRPQIGANGLVYIRYNEDGTLKSSVDKFYDTAALQKIANEVGASPNDLILLLAGEKSKTQKAMCELRLHTGSLLGLRTKGTFACLWVIDFPLLEWNEDNNRWIAVHHPFTAPKPEHIQLLNTNPAEVKADCYDMVINGIEISSGSMRIYNREMQERMLQLLGFSKEDANEKFGFLMEAFEYGAPPHGGIAFGFDRLCSILGEADSIRDFIAFPKNNAGKDVMINAPSIVDTEQLTELHLAIQIPTNENSKL